MPERQPGLLARSIPNALTLSRFPLAVVFALCMTTFSPAARIIGVAAAIIAMLSDFADGYVARRLGVDTDIGKLLDPLADAFFFVTCFTVIAWTGAIPWWLALPFVLRELIQHVYIRPAAQRRGVALGAMFIGKFKVACQCTALLVVATLETIRTFGTHLETWFDLRSLFTTFDWISLVSVAIAAAISVLSLWPYLRALSAIKAQAAPSQ